MVLEGVDDVQIGDILVYSSSSHPYPIIHRVTAVNDDGTYTLKGDNNNDTDPVITDEQVIGKALYRIPKIGWVKIWAAALVALVVGG